VGQALAAAQQQQQQEQKSAAAKSTSREPEDFEGTMYGPGVARQLVKAIREEKPEAAHEQKPAAGIVARAIGGGGGGVALPNMFWLKIKAAVFFIVFLGIVAGLVLWGYTASQADKAVKAKYNELNLEYTDFNARTGNLSPESLEKTLAPDLATLTKLLESAKTAQKDFPNSKVFTPRLDDLVAKVGFRVFERQLQQAIVKGDVKAVDAAVDQFMAVAPEDQKKLDKLARLVGRFQVFKRHYPDRPEISAKVPPSTLVKELVDSIDDLKKAVRDQKGLIPMDAKLFSRTATEAAEAEGLCGNWGTFWADYEKAKGTPAQLESFKKGYPHIKDWDAIK
jgi:hypothetical protein